MSIGSIEQAGQPAPSSPPASPSPAADTQQIVSPDVPISQELTPQSFSEFFESQPSQPSLPTQPQAAQPPGNNQPPTDTTTSGADDEGGVRAWLKGKGAAWADRYQTDEDALQGYMELQSAIGRRNDELAQLRAFHQQIQPYLPHLQQMLTAGQQQQQPSPPQQNRLTPEWREEWRALVKQDDDGKLVGPPEIVAKVQAAIDFARKAQLDPEGTLGPLIEDRARKIAGELVDQRIAQQFGQFQSVNHAQQFLRENAQWLFAGGNPNSGQLTDIGQQYSQLYVRACQNGASHEIADEYARGQINSSYALAQLQEIQRRQPPAVQQPPNARLMTNTPAVQAPTPDNPEGYVRDGDTVSDIMRRFYGMAPEAA